jgi:hypothetical protein
LRIARAADALLTVGRTARFEDRLLAMCRAPDRESNSP